MLRIDRTQVALGLTLASLGTALATGSSLADTSVSSGAGVTTATQTTPGSPTSTVPTSTTPAGQTTPSTPATTPTSPAPEKTPVKPAAPTRVTKLPSSAISDGTAALVVRLSGVPASDSPVPMFSPNVAGTWRAVGNSESFTPSSTLEPCSTYTLTVWAGTDALGHPPLGKRRTLTLHVACPSLQGVQQALARLRYLPYSVDAPYGRNSGSTRETRAKAAHYAYHPAVGRLVANVPHAPGLAYGSLDPTTRGALMVFQAAHGLPVTGSPDGSTWASLLASETLGHDDPAPYTFVTVSESIPEKLEVHRGGHVVLTTPANTGVAGAETERGTFPIYARYVSTTMTGTNPDGTKYSDPGVPWVNYFNGGDAVHGFPRPSYGSPQSNGCVELPIETARRVFPMLAIGDLVIVGG